MRDYESLIKKALDNYSDLFTVEETNVKTYEVRYRKELFMKVYYDYDHDGWMVEAKEPMSMDMIGEIQYYLESYLEDEE